MNRTTIAAAGLVLAQACQPALAADTQWYLYNGLTKRCVLPQHPTTKSPAAWEEWLRLFGRYERTQISRDDSGRILMVEVDAFADNPNQAAHFFFPTKAACEKTRAHWIANGTITDPEELK